MFSCHVLLLRRYIVGLLREVSNLPPNEVLQIMRISKSDKINPPGYCLALSHDAEDTDVLNFASKSDVMRVSL